MHERRSERGCEKGVHERRWERGYVEGWERGVLRGGRGVCM